MKYFSFTFALLFSMVAVAFSQTTTEQFATLLPGMSSDDLTVREQAQQDWQKICMEAGTPGKTELRASVNALMVEQLGKEIPLETKYWLLQQIQWTGDASVVPAIAKLLDDKDLRIRDRAARALALNPSAEAKTALENALKSADGVRANTIADALADRKIDIKVDVESKPTLDLPYVNEGEFDTWMKKYDGLSVQDQVRTLAAIKVRKAAKYLDTVRAAVKSDDESLKIGGLLAMEKIATVDDAPLLLNQLLTENRGAVVWVLSGIACPEFDQALLKALAAEKNNEQFGAIADVLSRRSVFSAKGTILERAASPDVENRAQLLSVAEPVSTTEDIPQFVTVALMIPPSRDRDMADQTVARLCKGDAAPVVGMMNASNTANFLPMLGRIGGKAAMDVVKEQLKSSSNHDIAVRALCNWPTAAVADELLVLVENANESDQNKIAALRAFVRVISLPDNEIGIRISAKEKIVKLRKAMGLATRLDEKRLIIDRVTSIRDPESVRFVLEYFDDKDLQQNVCRTVIEIAHHNNVRRPHKDLFGPALDKVLEKVENDGLKERALKYRKDM
jgi:HEAT repeat protein